MQHHIRWAISATRKKGCSGRVCDASGSEFGPFAQVEININHKPEPYPLRPYYGRFFGFSNAARRFLHEHGLDTLVLRHHSLADIKVQAWAIVGGVLSGRPHPLQRIRSTRR